MSDTDFEIAIDHLNSRCIQCGKLDINSRIWIHQSGIDPPDCYCERAEYSWTGGSKSSCETIKYRMQGDRCYPSWTRYSCDECIEKDQEKLYRKRFLRPVCVNDS
jgi:hypothetical protein